MPDATKPTVGLLFDYEFDARCHERLESDGLVQFQRHGFNIFSFPSNLALPFFGFEAYSQRLIRRGQREQWQAVLSQDETFGAILASLAAEALGLPGTAPEAILASQHKLWARQVMAQACPEVAVPASALDWRPGEPAPRVSDFPFFLKPIRASFSVLARRIHTQAELDEHLQFSLRERATLGWLVRPFEQLCATRIPDAPPALGFMREPIAEGLQFNLDGYVFEGTVNFLGAVAAVMYPGTQAFQRWEYPGQVPADALARAQDASRRFLAAVGFSHGIFNTEFIYNPRSEALTMLECNPRMASQFSDLYRAVDGIDLHRLGLGLALGDRSMIAHREQPRGRQASSLVWRSFGLNDTPPMPSRSRVAELRRAFPDAEFFVFDRDLDERRRDFKWLGSHRYGILNLSAQSPGDMFDQAQRAADLLGWPNAPFSEAIQAQSPTLLAAT